MNQTQIDFLRDFAIDHFPRAKAIREQSASTQEDFYNRLNFAAVMERARPGTTAVVYAAADVLESVCLLATDLEKKDRIAVLSRLTDAAHALCFHTGQVIDWLGNPSPEPDEDDPAPPLAKPLPSIAGKFLSTKETAAYLGKKPQTLTSWSSKQNGPLRPSKVGGNLLWSGDEILALLKRKQ